MTLLQVFRLIPSVRNVAEWGKKSPCILPSAQRHRISPHSCGVPHAGERGSLHAGNWMEEEQKVVDSFNYWVIKRRSGAQVLGGRRSVHHVLPGTPVWLAEQAGSAQGPSILRSQPITVHLIPS